MKYILVSIILWGYPATSFAQNLDDGCKAWSLVGKEVAERRDAGHSAKKTRSEMIASGISEKDSKPLVEMVYIDLKEFNPAAVEYALFSFCTRNPRVLY